jgi:hypothetical protein
MAIPKWIEDAVHIEKNSKVNFSDEMHSKLKDAAKAGHLSEEALEALAQVEQMLGVAADSVGVLCQRHLSDGAISKEAKPLPPPPPPPATSKVSPADMGMGPGLAEPQKPMMSKPKPGKLPGRVKEPETTKWKEIRFNKRTGTWQVVVTIRHTRNFLSENEAVDFTKKASLDVAAKEVPPPPSAAIGTYYVMAPSGEVKEGPFVDLVRATAAAQALEVANPGKTYGVKAIDKKP